MLTETRRMLEVLVIAAGLFVAAPSGLCAQQVPSYANAAAEETLKGTITGFDGAYTVYVRDVRGYTDNISLHQGTIINPTGIRLQAGMRVTIYGHANGPTFEANQIDTPYPAYPPYYGYPYYGGWSPGPYAYGPYWGAGFGWGWGWRGRGGPWW